MDLNRLYRLPFRILHILHPAVGDIASGNGNVDEGHQRTLWIEKVEHRLRIAKDGLECETDGFQILKVPEYDRQPPDMFTPLGWRLGLHNLDSVDTNSGSEAVKLCVPIVFGLEKDEKWVRFCDDVVPHPKRILACYGLHEEATELREEEIKQLLAFDVLCLALKIDMLDLESEDRRLWTSEHVTISIEEQSRFLSSFLNWSYIFNNDLFRMENQIPFDLVRRAIKHLKRLKYPLFEHDIVSDRSCANVGQVAMEPYLEKWMKVAVYCAMLQFMQITDDFYKDQNSNPRLSESHHILDAAYKAICGKEGLEWNGDNAQLDYIHIPSATKLKHSGLKIVGVAGPLCTMSYNKVTNRLTLPKMKMNDNTVATIRNMERYEDYVKRDKSMFHDYVNLMLDLIDSPDDMEYLTKCGVIDNGSRSRAFDMWKPLDQGMMQVLSSQKHNEMKNDIRIRCDRRRPKLWKEFKTLFCSRPWLIVPIIAATLVTFATLIQTYAAIIGSNRMEPKYKNP